MALSQIQCLDENHVNPRTHESKAEFFYCEDQRLALEALLRGGRDAFLKYVETRGLRGFLSDPELETLLGVAEPYDPDSELCAGNAEDGDHPLSLHYWPELSDTSIPRMDLGWPDSDSYRGVTRTTVYAQPPLDGQAHIKEVVRKMIAQAQKVIAVVMDVFTDVDIFRDLLDAGFRRRVSVYILLERTTLPHFMSMCHRANMHMGHLKHLRVRCTEGAEFYTRSCTKVKGRMGHRFMFVDGDKAVSGSYSFTWMSSRLDRNLITVVTGQAVDAFDRLFRLLYVTSRFVDLRKITMGPEPEPEPLPQPATVVPPSAAVARKLINPKYALVAVGNPIPNLSPSADHTSPKEPQNLVNTKNPDVPETNKRRQKQESKEAIQDVPPLHPGLVDLEKACLISYLPTWPEPDPPSDVIGFINIRDVSKPPQVHLQRSEMFETSQAIRFSSPLSMPKETLPEVAKPRKFGAKHEERDKCKPTANKTNTGESQEDSVQPTQLTQPADDKCKTQAPEQKPPASGQESEPAKETTKVLTVENKVHSSTSTSQDAGCNTTTHLAAHTSPKSSSKASSPNSHGSSDGTQTITTNGPKSESLSGSNAENETETSLSTQRTHGLESNSTQSPHPHSPTDSNTQQHTQERTGLPFTNALTQAVDAQQQNSAFEKHTESVSSTPLSESNQIPITSSVTINACIVSSCSLPPLTSSSTAFHPPLPSATTSSPLTPTPPIPKPRTIQLVIKDGGASDGQTLPEISVRRTGSLASTGSLVVHSKPDIANVVHAPPEKEPETVPELHSSKTGTQKDAENTGNPEETPQQKQNVASQETKGEEAVGQHDNRAETQSQSDVLPTDAPKAGGVNFREIVPKEVDPRVLASTDCKVSSKTEADQTATTMTEIKAPEKAQTGCELSPNEKSNNVTQDKTHNPKRHDPQRISHCEMSHNNGTLDTVNCLKAAIHTPVSATANSHTSKDKDTPDDGTSIRRGNPNLPSAPHADSKPNVAKHNLHISPTSQESQPTPKPRGSSHTPERPLRLHLSDTHTRDLRTPTTEQEPRSLVRAPIPDVFPPDSRTHPPDPQSYCPYLQSPDASDASPREDSTTSEEYYECSESSCHDPVSDSVGYCNHGMIEGHFSFTHTNTPNATTITSTSVSPAHINNKNSCPAVLGTASCSETQSLSGPVRVSAPSLLEKKVIMRGEEETVNEENGREEDEKGRNVEEGRTEQGSQGTERRVSAEAKKTSDNLKQAVDLTETVEKDKKLQPQVPKRKRPVNKSATESLVDGGATLGNSTKEGTDPKRLSTDGLKPDKVSHDGETSNKEKVVDKAALSPSSTDKRDRPPPTRDGDGQKLSRIQQQQDSGSSSPTRPPRPPRPLSAAQPLGTRPWGSFQLNQGENKDLHGRLQDLDNTSSPHRPPSRPSPPLVLGAVRSAAVQKQAKVSYSQHSLLSQQSLAAQGRARVGQSPNQHPYLKPQSSFLLTPSNIQSQPHFHSQNQTVSVREAHRQEEGRSPFTITFGRLYSLKGLRDKMNKPPAQSKRGSTSSPAPGRKSTS